MLPPQRSQTRYSLPLLSYSLFGSFFSAVSPSFLGSSFFSPSGAFGSSFGGADGGFCANAGATPAAIPTAAAANRAEPFRKPRRFKIFPSAVNSTIGVLPPTGSRPALLQSYHDRTRTAATGPCRRVRG